MSLLAALARRRAWVRPRWLARAEAPAADESTTRDTIELVAYLEGRGQMGGAFEELPAGF